MRAKRFHTAWNIALAILVVGSAVCVYGNAYVLRGTRELATRVNGQRVIVCTFPSAWEASVFTPVAIIEGCLIGREVYPDHPYRLDCVLFQVGGELMLDDEPLTEVSLLP